MSGFHNLAVGFIALNCNKTNAVLDNSIRKKRMKWKMKKNSNNKKSVWRFDKLNESHYLKQAKNFLAKNTTSYQSQYLGECLERLKFLLICSQM